MLAQNVTTTATFSLRDDGVPCIRDREPALERYCEPMQAIENTAQKVSNATRRTRRLSSLGSFPFRNTKHERFAVARAAEDGILLLEALVSASFELTKPETAEVR